MFVPTNHPSVADKNWRFDKDIAPVFDVHVRQSVPGYVRMQQSVVRLTDFFCSENSLVVDLGCSTGETLSLIQNRHPDRRLHLIGIDESPDMIQQAIKKTAGNPAFVFKPVQLETYDFPSNVGFITSILTMQFVEKRHRRKVVEDIYESLEEGGAFVFIEKTYAKSGQIQDIFNQLYHDFKEEQGIEALDIRKKDKSLRGVMFPNTSEENEAMLQSAGFSEVEMFFKDLHFCGWIAIK